MMTRCGPLHTTFACLILSGCLVLTSACGGAGEQGKSADKPVAETARAPAAAPTLQPAPAPDKAPAEGAAADKADAPLVNTKVQVYPLGIPPKADEPAKSEVKASKAAPAEAPKVVKPKTKKTAKTKKATKAKTKTTAKAVKAAKAAPPAKKPAKVAKKPVKADAAPVAAPKPVKVSKGKKVYTYNAKKGKVIFGHRAHQKVTKCKTCHHKAAPKTSPKRCRSCHGKDPKAPKIKKSIHATCKGCHKKKKKGPTKCAECHIK